MNYQLVRPTLKTGDIVLFRGKGLVSLAIMWVCSLFSRRPTQYSHVGMIVREKTRVFILESTTLNGKRGVQLNLFSSTVKAYNGKLTVRQLKTQRTELMVLRLQAFIQNNLGKPYEQHLWELIGASTPWHLFKGNNTDWFCSELIARVYQIWGLIPDNEQEKEFSPQDFGLDGAIDYNLRYSQQPARLGKEIEITK